MRMEYAREYMLGNVCAGKEREHLKINLGGEL
jgi:hypothetical protein